MIVATFEDGITEIEIRGELTQWDYGEKLQICGLNLLTDTEVHFALYGSFKSVIRLAKRDNDGTINVNIPNVLLQDGRSIFAFVYLVDGDYGKTIRTVGMRVKRRAMPQEVCTEETENILEQVLSGKADNIEITEGCIQLLANGKVIGDRIRLPSVGGNDREIELKNNGNSICWRYTDSNDWIDLVQLCDLRGEDGKTPEFEIREGHLFAIYKED